MRTRIKLVIQLFVEAGRAAQSMPLILIQPLWTFVALVVVCSMWVLGLLMVESAGHPEVDSVTGFVYYKKGLISTGSFVAFRQISTDHLISTKGIIPIRPDIGILYQTFVPQTRSSRGCGCTTSSAASGSRSSSSPASTSPSPAQSPHGTSPGRSHTSGTIHT